MNLSDRVALVTGGASGIGRGIAGVLLSRGARVAITDVRPEALEETRAYFSGYRGRVLTYPLDVSDRPAFGGVVSYIERDLGLIEVLINNAGVGYSGVPLHQTPDNDIDWVLDVNLKGVLNGQDLGSVKIILGSRILGNELAHVMAVDDPIIHLEVAVALVALAAVLAAIPDLI